MHGFIKAILEIFENSILDQMSTIFNKQFCFKSGEAWFLELFIRVQALFDMCNCIETIPEIFENTSSLEDMVDQIENTLRSCTSPGP